MTKPRTAVMAITDVRIGDRRREDLGDLTTLATSIATYGLLHPIVVDHDGTLVAGERRLRACQSLGYTEIEARDFGDLTEAERREIELEENLRRKDLTPYERAKDMTRLAETTAQVLRQEDGFLANLHKNPKGGRPPKPDSQERIAERMGETQEDISRAKAQVEVADAYPFMQKPEWKQYHVLEAREVINRLPEEERPSAATLLDQPAIPPTDAISILGKLVQKPAPERADIYALDASPDERDRQLALTRAAELPPMPDPRGMELKGMASTLRGWIRRYPDDPYNERIKALATDAGALAKEILGG